jgi:hypothetical protein
MLVVLVTLNQVLEKRNATDPGSLCGNANATFPISPLFACGLGANDCVTNLANALVLDTGACCCDGVLLGGSGGGGGMEDMTVCSTWTLRFPIG